MRSTSGFLNLVSLVSTPIHRSQTGWNYGLLLLIGYESIRPRLEIRNAFETTGATPVEFSI